VGEYASLRFDAQGRAAIAYYDAGISATRLWHDANGDFAADVDELMVIDDAGSVGKHTSVQFSADGRAAVAYYDATNKHLKLWFDADADFTAAPEELVVIDGSGGAGADCILAMDNTGAAVIVYFAADTGKLTVWRDLDSDFQRDEGEFQHVPHITSPGPYAIAMHPRLGFPLIAAFDTTVNASAVTAHLDWDNDGLCFMQDNCPAITNPDQADADADGVGDLCDPCPLVASGDMNADGVVNADDVPLFLAVLLDPQNNPPESLCPADVNGDGNSDGEDVQAIVDLLSP